MKHAENWEKCIAITVGTERCVLSVIKKDLGETMKDLVDLVFEKIDKNKHKIKREAVGKIKFEGKYRRMEVTLDTYGGSLFMFVRICKEENHTSSTLESIGEPFIFKSSAFRKFEKLKKKYKLTEIKEEKDEEE